VERIERFEDLIAWQRARELHRLLQVEFNHPAFSRAFALRDQLERAATSVMGNIAEGYERTGPKEFAHGLSMAKGSAGEVRSHLYAALDAGFLRQEAFEPLRALADETSRVIAGLRVAVLRGTQRAP
jgi:four helix bundle protein